MSTAASVCIGLMLLFSARRLLWVLASWVRARESTGALPRTRFDHVLIAVSFRNEQESLPSLLASLDELEVDSEQLSICLIDDASTDSSAAVAAAWIKERPKARLISLRENVGKAEALNRALASTSERLDVIVVYDADQRPHPDSLRRLIAPFADANTAAVCGYRQPTFHKLNPVAAYACLEAWTHQLVNLAAKDTLGLNPPTMGGNCAYRRSALERVGGFPSGAFSEDVEVSLAVANNGGRIRFVEQSVTDHLVADSLRHFINQRVRWNHGLAAARRHVRGLESAFVAAGYMDRILLVLVASCVVADLASPLWLLVFAVPALAALFTALAKARPRPLLLCMVAATLVPMFFLDIGVTLLSMLRGVSQRRVVWIDRRTAGSTTQG